jgi:DNA-binding response OmpR family regulator
VSSDDAASPLHEDILVVDDTPATLKLLADILSQGNYRVRPASDGELALRSIQAQTPALVLLDIRMPGMDGYEVCRRLKADAATRSIPVIFLSALEDDSDKVHAFQVGGVDYLTKPFRTDEVLARVRTHLALRRMQLDLESRNADLRAAYETLEDRVNRRTAELQQAKEQLQRLNELLEHRVAERTALAEHRASQLRLLAAELAQAEERERRRIARVLHDHLQQILVVARMKTKLLRDHSRDDRLHTLSTDIDQLLSHALDESRSLTASLSPPVLYDRGLSAGLQWLARQTRDHYGLHVELRVETDAEPAELGLRILLFQAVRELLLNVTKHAHAKSVRIELTRPADGKVHAVVADDGIGFDPAKVQCRETSGGFGLFSIRERLDLVGGGLHVDSAPDRGTRVTVDVPRCCSTAGAPPPAPPAPPQAPTPKPAPAGAYSEKIRILVADDHAIVRQGLAGMLGEHAGFEVVGQAADGLEAVELALANCPDAILMDVSMPKLSGMEATRRIVEALPSARVIGLSMHEAEDMAAAMLKAGAVAYLRKDAHAEVLFSTILQHTADARSRTNLS